MVDTAHIYVGCAANWEDLESQSVLEYTIRERASIPVKITWMQQSHDVTSWFYVGNPGGWAAQSWATPFSGFRWAIPYIARDLGLDRAIYMDSDFIVFGDVADLWNIPFQDGKAVVAKANGRYCCSLWHTERALAKLPTLAALMANPNAHAGLTAYYAAHKGLIQEWAPDNQWNHLDMQRFPLSEVTKRGVKAIHYTRMEQQLQLKHALPRLREAGMKHWFDRATRPNDWPGLQALFDSLLAAALVGGYPLERYMKKSPFGKYHIRGK